MIKILKLARKYWILIVILIAGVFLRLYNGAELWGYAHDSDLAGWIVKDVLVNHHLRLIGQLTSTPGVFIGPLFYYLQIPFYLAFKMDPIGGIYLVAAIGAFAIWSCWYVFSRIFNQRIGTISALIYSLSIYTVFNDKEVVPTMPLMLWSIWFFYSLHLVIKGEHKKGFLLAAILTALIWHVNFGLVILLPVYLVAIYLSKKKIDIKTLIVPAIVLVVLSLPLILFEVRHGFSQTNSVLFSATQSQGDVLKGTAKAAKVFDVVIKNVTALLWGNLFEIPKAVAFWLVAVSSLIVFLKGKIKRATFTIMVLWLGLTAGFFALYSKPVSEYYLNSITIVWIAFISVTVGSIIESKKYRFLGYLLLLAFVFVSFYRFFTYRTNGEGYVQRKQVVAYIKNDAAAHGYPCVSISYITSPGANFGYRYFIWQAGLKTKEISDRVPVYSIVFPLSGVDRFDKNFGSLGVINPDYSRYNKKVIDQACQGNDTNLTDSMFGYTQ